MKKAMLLAVVSTLAFAACEKKESIVGGSPSGVVMSFNATGIWTGSYTVTDHMGRVHNYPLTLTMANNPRANNRPVDGTWDNGDLKSALIGSRSTDDRVYLTVVGDSGSGSNPFKHSSYIVEGIVTDSLGKQMSLTINGNDYLGAEKGSGMVTRP